MSFVFQACMNPDNRETNSMSLARMSHALSTSTLESDPLRGAVEILEVRVTIKQNKMVKLDYVR